MCIRVQDINSYQTMLSKTHSKARKIIASLDSENNIRHKKKSATRTEEPFCIKRENVVPCLNLCASVSSLGSDSYQKFSRHGGENNAIPGIPWNTGSFFRQAAY
jgi:hypothetical protein